MPRHPTGSARSKGLSLFEGLIALLIGSILLTLSAAAFQRWIRDAQLTAVINDFVAAVHLARQTAQTRALPITLCPSTDGIRCDEALDWSHGWLMRVGEPHRPVLDEGDFLQRGSAVAAQKIRVTANRSAFSFRPFTLRDTNGTLQFCDRQGLARARQVIVSPTGRPRLAYGTTSKASGNCAP